MVLFSCSLMQSERGARHICVRRCVGGGGGGGGDRSRRMGWRLDEVDDVSAFQRFRYRWGLWFAMSRVVVVSNRLSAAHTSLRGARGHREERTPYRRTGDVFASRRRRTLRFCRRGSFVYFNPSLPSSPSPHQPLQPSHIIPSFALLPRSTSTERKTYS